MANNAAAMTHWSPFVSNFRDKNGDAECTGVNVILSNRTVIFGEHLVCIGDNSIQANGVDVQNGAELELVSPQIHLGSNSSVRVRVGGQLRLISE